MKTKVIGLLLLTAMGSQLSAMMTDKEHEELEKAMQEKGYELVSTDESEKLGCKTVAESLPDFSQISINVGEHFTQNHPMIVDLTNYTFEKSDELRDKDLDWKMVIDDEDMNSWIKLAAMGFEVNQEEIISYVEKMKNNPDAAELSFYMGTLDGIWASTCLMVTHKTNIASLHLVSTVPNVEYRRKKLATLVTLRALSDAKDVDCSCMILISSPVAQQLFTQLGFEDFETYKSHMTGDVSDALTSSMIALKITDGEPTTDNPETKTGYCLLF